MSNNQESKEITICLEESKYAHGFNQNDNIHLQSFDRVKEIIKKQIEQLKKEKSQSSIEHQYNTISVFGGRGTGKTTFILSMLQSIKDDNKKDAQILKIIDPTQMEEKEHVFLVVLSLIDEAVREKIEEFKKGECSDVCCREKGWKDKLSSLAKGLPTLEGLNNKQYENWDDDLYIIEKGLNNVKSAYDLEKNFHELVDSALEILGKKFFVLAFDDIDVDMSKGWRVLETLRKYLTTPKLVVFLSGNLTLYSYNVRLHQWKQFKELKGFEERDYKDQVNQLEGQYLLKVLKPENRIQLRTLFDYKQIFKTKYEIKEEGKEIKEVYSDLLENLGIHNNSTQQSFINYLLGLSIRSQISILSDYKKSDIMSQINVYVSRMMADGIDVDLSVQSPVFTVISIFEYLTKTNSFPHSYLLIPNTIDHDINGVLMGLTTIFANQIKQNPWIIFDYMLRVGYARYLKMQLSEEAFVQMQNYTGITQDMRIKNIVLLMTACGRANNLNMPELIQLEGLAITAKQSKEKKANAIDNVLGRVDVSTAQKILALLPLFSLNNGRKDSTELYYSILPLLSAISMIIRSGEDEEAIKGLLSDLSLHRTYPIPANQQNVSTEAESELSSNEELSEKLKISMEDPSVQNLVDKILDWRNSFVNEDTTSLAFIVPPYLLGRIMTRFTSALVNVPKQDNLYNLADLLQRHLIVFLNAVLVEETKEKFGDKVDINNNNPTGSNDLFINNLSKVTKEIKVENQKEDNKLILGQLNLTRFLLYCPLIRVFIEDDVFDKIKDYIDDGYHFGDKSLYEILEDVKVKTKKEDGINITKDNIPESLKRIIDTIGKDKFKEDIYNKEDSRKTRKKILELEFINTIGQGCAKELNKLFEKEYINK